MTGVDYARYILERDLHLALTRIQIQQTRVHTSLVHCVFRLRSGTASPGEQSSGRGSLIGAMAPVDVKLT